MSLATIYNIILESFIIFVIFAIFFYILIKYILTPYALNVTSTFAIKQLDLYGLTAIADLTLLRDKLETSKASLESSKSAVQAEVDSHNKEYEAKQIYILSAMTLGLLVILVIPVLLGFIKLSDIEWTHLLKVAIINLAIILGIEYILITMVVGEYTTIRFYPALEEQL